MEILIKATTFIIFTSILISPILILKQFKKEQIILSYYLINLVTLAILIVLFTWWNNKSDLILLKHYGYNINGMNHDEFYGNVSPKNIERVKNLETSIMGIGWPLKAIFGYIIFIPYLIFVYFGKKHKIKK